VARDRAEEWTMSGEVEWRSIAGGLYEVSSDGRVRRVGLDSIGRPVRGGELKLRRIWTGYLRAGLSIEGATRARYAHVLVAEAFLGPCPDAHEVNHKNGNKADNRVENLEYVTRSENMQHARRSGLLHPQRGDAHYWRRHPEAVRVGVAVPVAKLDDDKVRAIRARYAAGGITQRELAADYGVSEALISFVTARKIWRHVA
jgi:hypothetical protein